MGTFGAVATDGVEERFADVEIERVAKFVRARDPAAIRCRWRDRACRAAELCG